MTQKERWGQKRGQEGHCDTNLESKNGEKGRLKEDGTSACWELGIENKEGGKRSRPHTNGWHGITLQEGGASKGKVPEKGEDGLGKESSYSRRHVPCERLRIGRQETA